MATNTAARTAASASEQGRRDWLALASILLAVLGVLIAGYLSWAELTSTPTSCTLTGAGCDIVQRSAYSKIGPLPVAFLGLGGYIAILGVLLLEARIRGPQKTLFSGALVSFLARRGRLLVFAMTLFGFLFTGYLTAIEAFVLHAWCQWCIFSAIIMTLLFGISFLRLWRGMNTGTEVEDEGEGEPVQGQV